MNKTVVNFAIMSLLLGMGFAARPLMTDDCATMMKGALGAEIGYDSNRTLAYVLKNSPRENIECSLSYNLPTGTSFALDQVEFGTKVALVSCEEGIGFTGISKYNPFKQSCLTTVVASKTGKQYCIHANVGYVPSQAASLLGNRIFCQ